jgi:ABC-type transport system involved in cytochrome bd biosynthesis fused ATPase/permease subunit
MGFQEFKNAGKKAHAVTLFAFVGFLLLLISITAHIGWWTVSTHVSAKHCALSSSLTEEVFPTGIKVTQVEGQCNGVKKSQLTIVKNFSDDKDSCYQNGQTVQILTILAIVATIVGILVHVFVATSNIIAPSGFMIASGLAAAALSIFLLHNDCVTSLKSNDLGKIGT